MVAWNEIIGVLVMYSSQRNEFALASVKRYTVFASRLAITVSGAQEHQQFRLLNTAMSKATQAIFITRYDGTIVWFNQALSDISGYKSGEIMDSTPRMFDSGHHEKEFWGEMWCTILQGNAWSGDVLNRRKDGSLYSVLLSITPLYDEQGVIAYFLGVQQDVSEKKELERKIEYLAYHDVLTGLPNRILFNDRVKQAISYAKRDQAGLSLLFVDLDGFKEVNDKYGHAAGDRLLKEVAERLRDCVREGDTVARLGGDEFIVLLRNIAELVDLQNVAQKIIARIALPYDIGGRTGHVTASVGISRYPDDGKSGEKLMNCADEAMYAAKRAGKNQYSIWKMPAALPNASEGQH